jgi:hypothetical protein
LCCLRDLPKQQQHAWSTEKGFETLRLQSASKQELQPSNIFLLKIAPCRLTWPRARAEEREREPRSGSGLAQRATSQPAIARTHQPAHQRTSQPAAAAPAALKASSKRRYAAASPSAAETDDPTSKSQPPETAAAASAAETDDPTTRWPSLRSI